MVNWNLLFGESQKDRNENMAATVPPTVAPRQATGEGQLGGWWVGERGGSGVGAELEQIWGTVQLACASCAVECHLFSSSPLSALRKVWGRAKWLSGPWRVVLTFIQLDFRIHGVCG